MTKQEFDKKYQKTREFMAWSDIYRRQIVRNRRKMFNCNLCHHFYELNSKPLFNCSDTNKLQGFSITNITMDECKEWNQFHVKS